MMKRREQPLPPTLVRASAGTGKTYQLTGRLLRILLQGSPPESILATTFTRKAAGEILTRILINLARAADERDERGLADLRDQLDWPDLQPQECLQVLASLLRNIHRLRICTLDSFFSQLARSFAFELGLPPAWRLCDEIEGARFREAAVTGLVRQAEHSEMSTLIAMLGKGETRRSVAEDLVRVIQEAYDQSRGCGTEVWDRLRVNKLPTRSQLQTALEMFQAASPKQKSLAELVANMAAVLQHHEYESLVEHTLIVNIAKARRQRAAVKFGRASFAPELDEAFDTLYAAVRCRSLSLLRAQNRATGSILATYDHQINEIKLAARAFEFDDIAHRLAARFRNLDFQDLDHRIDARLDHVLLDEFQDTSPPQWQVLKPFALRLVDPDLAPDAALTPRSFFCVGDAKQAIYRWRGGVAEILDAVTDQMPTVIEQPLHRSYRSSPVVIDFVNRVFQHIDRHPLYRRADSRDPGDAAGQAMAALRRFATSFPRHETARGELPGYVCLETAPPDDQADRDVNFQKAAQIAIRIHQADPKRNIGILTRSNAGVGKAIRELEQELAGRPVDVSQEGGNPLTDSAAVELVLSALMLSEHPGDRRWSYHTQASPLAHIDGFGDNLVRRRLTEFGLAETVEFLAAAVVPVCDARDTVRLKQLVQLAIQYESHATPRVRDFVAAVQATKIQRPQAAKIRAMTVHQAKGLEFDAVILPELEGNLAQIGGRCIAQIPQIGDPPSALSRHLSEKQRHFLTGDWQRAFAETIDAAMTESVCLLYVAITRARQAVHLVIGPAGNPAYEYKHGAALIYHALEAPGDPTTPNSVLFESGDRNWYR